MQTATDFFEQYVRFNRHRDISLELFCIHMLEDYGRLVQEEQIKLCRSDFRIDSSGKIDDYYIKDDCRRVVN